MWWEFVFSCVCFLTLSSSLPSWQSYGRVEAFCADLYQVVADGYKLKLKQESWSITKEKNTYYSFLGLSLVLYFNGLTWKIVLVMHTRHAISISLSTRKGNHHWTAQFILMLRWIFGEFFKQFQSWTKAPAFNLTIMFFRFLLRLTDLIIIEVFQVRQTSLVLLFLFNSLKLHVIS